MDYLQRLEANISRGNYCVSSIEELINRYPIRDILEGFCRVSADADEELKVQKEVLDKIIESGADFNQISFGFKSKILSKQAIGVLLSRDHDYLDVNKFLKEILVEYMWSPPEAIQKRSALVKLALVHGAKPQDVEFRFLELTEDTCQFLLNEAAHKLNLDEFLKSVANAYAHDDEAIQKKNRLIELAVKYGADPNDIDFSFLRFDEDLCELFLTNDLHPLNPDKFLKSVANVYTHDDDAIQKKSRLIKLAVKYGADPNKVENFNILEFDDDTIEFLLSNEWNKLDPDNFLSKVTNANVNSFNSERHWVVNEELLNKQNTLIRLAINKGADAGKLKFNLHNFDEELSEFLLSNNKLDANEFLRKVNEAKASVDDYKESKSVVDKQLSKTKTNLIKLAIKYKANPNELFFLLLDHDAHDVLFDNDHHSLSLNKCLELVVRAHAYTDEEFQKQKDLIIELVDKGANFNRLSKFSNILKLDQEFYDFLLNNEHHPLKPSKFLNLIAIAHTSTDEELQKKKELIVEVISRGGNPNELHSFSGFLKLDQEFYDFLLNNEHHPLEPSNFLNLVAREQTSTDEELQKKKELMIDMMNRSADPNELSSFSDILKFDQEFYNFLLNNEQHPLKLNKFLGWITKAGTSTDEELQKKKGLITTAIDKGADLNESGVDADLDMIEFLVEKGLELSEVLRSIVARSNFSQGYIDVINKVFKDNYNDKLAEFFSQIPEAVRENFLVDEKYVLIDSNGDTLLHALLKENVNELAEKLLFRFPSLVNFENNDDKTPIYIANSVGNKEGVSLCLQYDSKNMNESNHCREIAEEMKGFPSYQLRELPSTSYNLDKADLSDNLVVFIIGPNTKDLLDFDRMFGNLISENVPLIKIGDGKAPLSLKGIKNSLERFDKFAGKISLFVLMHGHLSDNGYELKEDVVHEVKMSSDWIPSKELFKSLNKVFNSPLDIVYFSCFGGGAIQDVDELPLGSKLLTLARFDKAVSAKTDLDEISLNRENVSSEYFMYRYLYGLKDMNNIPGVGISGGERKFLDVNTDFIGTSIDKCYTEAVIDRLDKRLCEGKEECFIRVRDSISAIETSKSLDELKASEEISIRNLEERYKEREDKKDDEEYRSHDECVTDNDDIELDVLKVTLVNTDFSTCSKVDRIGSSTIELCEGYEPKQPMFGMSLLVLHVLEEIKKDGICEESAEAEVHDAEQAGLMEMSLSGDVEVTSQEALKARQDF